MLITWGFLLRLEAEGLTSLIRCLGLAPGEYFNLLHFIGRLRMTTVAYEPAVQQILPGDGRSLIAGKAANSRP